MSVVVIAATAGCLVVEWGGGGDVDQRVVLKEYNILFNINKILGA